MIGLMRIFCLLILNTCATILLLKFLIFHLKLYKERQLGTSWTKGSFNSLHTVFDFWQLFFLFLAFFCKLMQNFLNVLSFVSYKKVKNIKIGAKNLKLDLVS